MGRYLGKRLISTIPLLLVISFVVFMFIHMIPGDPARLVAGQDATKEDVAVVREQLGLDEPLLVQYGKYMKGLFTGDLGSSIKNGKTVTETIAPRLKPTIMLTFSSMIWAAIIGIAIGIIAAIIAGKTAQEICDDINAGMRDLMVGALLCGVASAIAVVMDKGVITDTIVYWLEQLLATTPPALSAIAIFWEQAIFNALIPGATALTILTMPILSPLGSLLDVSQQAIVSANAWGGQLTDIFFPTSGFFVATLVIAKVEYTKWLRFYTPLMLVLGAVCCAALYLQQQFNLNF